MAIEFEKTYSQEEFRNLLTTFQNDIQQNKYNVRNIKSMILALVVFSTIMF